MSRAELTREEWLNQAAVEVFVEVFYPAGFTPPPYRLSTGWTGRGKSKTILGQCWPRSASADGRNEVFVSPILDDPYEALDVLVHELVHAVDDCQHKHGREFKRIATAIGLTGPMKSAHAGLELETQLRRILGKLPPYPHRKLDFDKRDKQSTRMIRMQCTGCGYVARTTRKWLDEAGPTICPSCRTAMAVDEPVAGSRALAPRMIRTGSRTDG